MVLEREREIFGPTMVQGRDGGSAAIRKQLAACKAIKVREGGALGYSVSC